VFCACDELSFANSGVFHCCSIVVERVRKYRCFFCDKKFHVFFICSDHIIVGSLGKIFVFVLDKDDSKSLPWIKILSCASTALPIADMAFIESELWACSGNLLFVYETGEGRYELARTVSLEAPAFVGRMLPVSFGEFLLVFVAQQNKLVVIDALTKYEKKKKRKPLLLTVKTGVFVR
jgi:hypothetical protein